jgi:hypothetical protein
MWCLLTHFRGVAHIHHQLAINAHDEYQLTYRRQQNDVAADHRVLPFKLAAAAHKVIPLVIYVTSRWRKFYYRSKLNLLKFFCSYLWAPHKEFSYNSLCDKWEKKSFLEIAL